LRLPRNLSGAQLVRLLARYGYEQSRQTGSHIRLTSTIMGSTHHITVPAHRRLKIGTLASIVSDVARYVEKDREAVAAELFG
jgi:predicted RNA binding protein YcfA (HicA-like mRNA interferase family)